MGLTGLSRTDNGSGAANSSSSSKEAKSRTHYVAPVHEGRGMNRARTPSVFPQRAEASDAEGSPCGAPCEVVDFAFQVVVEFDSEPLQSGG